MEAAKLLQDQGAHVTVRDNAAANATVNQRAEALRQLGISVELGETIAAMPRFDFCVLSPGINPERAAGRRRLRQAGLPMFGELELAYRFCECPIVAITGTNGKTTTTELVNARPGRGRQADEGFRQHRHGLFRRGARQRESRRHGAGGQLVSTRAHRRFSSRASACISTSRPTISTATSRWRNTKRRSGRSSATRPRTTTRSSTPTSACRK